MSFSSALGGPFDFSVFAGDGGPGEGVEHIEATGSFAAGPISFAGGYMEEVDGGERIGGTVSGTAANITLLAGYESGSDVECAAMMPAETAADHGTAGTTGTAGMTHDVTDAVPAAYCDEDRYGFNLTYSMGEGAGGGKAYIQYGQRDSADAHATKRDVDYWTLGYSYFVSETVHVRLVHQTKDAYNKVAGSD